MEATMLFKRILFIPVVLALSFSVSSPAAAQGKGEALVFGRDTATAIPGRYIVVFKAGTEAANMSAAAEHARGLGGNVDFVYESALSGFAGNFPEQALFGLSHNPNVEFIERSEERRVGKVWTS